MLKLIKHTYGIGLTGRDEVVRTFTKYTVTSVAWEEEKDANLRHDWGERFGVPTPEGEGWELVAFSATTTRLFWTWKREEI